MSWDDRSTPAVFGETIHTYSIRQAVEDGATVPIFYEARLARIQLTEDERPNLDDQFEELTEDEEEPTREQLKSAWAKLEALWAHPSVWGSPPTSWPIGIAAWRSSTARP
ncbi:MAG: hypothetical protein IPI35_07730 [Deltaproteobacteria bacterium]|nr:hypothetical protein [Deltaproteobacteria bacterium]